MSSEAAQKAYPNSGNMSDYQQEVFREVFDRGAVEALRWYIAKKEPYLTELGVETVLKKALDEWEAGR